jgi:AraC family transcriptional regulator
MAIHADFSMVFADPDTRPDVEKIRTWPGFAGKFVVLPSGACDYSWSGDTHYLALHDIELLDGETALEGGPRDLTRDLRGTITFLPRGTKISGWSVLAPRQNVFTALFFDPAKLREEIGFRYERSELKPLLYARNNDLEATLQTMQRLLQQNEPDDLYAEVVCMAAALEVLQISPDIPRGNLSKRQTKMVLDYIEANLARNVNISEIAAVAELSRFHFARAFKSTTGKSPYNYILSQRIGRSIALLSSDNVPIEEAARTVGFRSAAQFRRAFFNATGSTPQAFRRKLR